MKDRKSRFDLFRCQILPLERGANLDLFQRELDSDELLLRKNEFFGSAIEQLRRLDFPRTETELVQIYKEDDFYIFKLFARRKLSRENLDETEDEIENWPSILVAVWNAPERQLVLVQHRQIVFHRTAPVVLALREALNESLLSIGLVLQIDPLFYKEDFWKVVRVYEGKISAVRFFLTTPNMANISGALAEDLKDLSKNTNAVRSELELRAHPVSALELSETNRTLTGIVVTLQKAVEISS